MWIPRVFNHAVYVVGAVGAVATNIGAVGAVATNIGAGAVIVVVANIRVSPIALKYSTIHDSI
jgi:hypothetical protein